MRSFASWTLGQRFWASPSRTGEGTPADVVLGFGSLEGYLDNPACYGATIGPSANRTDGGEVTIGGVRYQLPQNDGPDKRNNLHTDLDHGLHKRVWHAEAEPRSCSVTFSTTLEDGELGLPGRRTFSATYTLAATEAGSDLTIRYACETDAPTFVNMTSHTYFNLAGHDAGSVDAQLVSLDATDFLPIREDSVSAGEVRPGRWHAVRLPYGKAARARRRGRRRAARPCPRL